MNQSQGPTTLRGSFLTMRIIVAALTMGVLVFSGVVLMQHKPKAEPDVMMRLLAIGMAVGGVVLSFVVPRIVLAAGGKLGNSAQPQGDARFAAELSGNPLAPGGVDSQSDDSPEMLSAAGKLQTATIIGSALLEGPAFFGLVNVMQGDHLAMLGVPAVLVILLAANIPLSYEGYRARVASLAAMA